MKWRGRKQSSNIEDRRGQRTTGYSRIPGGRRLRLPGGRAGGGSIGLILVVIVLAMVFGIDPTQLLSGSVPSGPSAGSSTSQPTQNAAEDELASFVGVVVKETEDMWTKIFDDSGMSYREPVVVLYSDQTGSGCGLANSATGPFYCPADQKIYIDLSFYDQLRRQFGAPGDFAQAYVVAHEIGHHIQNLTGVLPEFNQARARLSQEEQNAWSVRVELQADCYAGVWAAYAGQQSLLERGDIEEALNAANKIGDDTLQKSMQGYAVHATFTHGSAAQRQRWFARGYDSGDPGACDTFNVANP